MGDQPAGGRDEPAAKADQPAGETQQPAADPSEDTDRPGSRVLVVDDDSVIRHLIAVNLQLEGFEVHTAADGIEGVDRARELRPDVITLDVMMPRLDGWQTVARLRNDPATAAAKICLVTARAQRADLERGAELGVDAYVTKPFDPAELVATVRRLAGHRPA